MHSVLQIQGITNMEEVDAHENSWNTSDEHFSSGSACEDEKNSHLCQRFNHISNITDVLTKNAIFNITFNDLLYSQVTLEGLDNVTIIGHRDPVVKCNDVGAVKFISCKNVTIDSIWWEGCGSKYYPGIEFYNTSNISFQRCSFHRFKSRGISISEMYGNVHINNCIFTHIEYTNHGTVIHYLASAHSHTEPKLIIQNCKFTLNRAIQSIIYIDGSSNSIPVDIYLKDDVFLNNTGVMLYISHSILYIKGDANFKGNFAKAGAGIYSNNSIVKFCDNSVANFTRNSATVNGGAAYLIDSIIFFGANSIITFIYNKANDSGGAVYSSNSKILFESNSSVSFNVNKASNDGGAISCWSSSHIIFDGNSSVTFNNNKASGDGGAVYCQSSSHITFDGNSSVLFNNNKASDWGGAVSCQHYSNINFTGNSSVKLNNNKALVVGGAVFCWFQSHITFDGNSNVIFNYNEATAGGAIISGSNISAKENSTVLFLYNSATLGGAIYSTYHKATILFEENCVIHFKHNKATESGGALFVNANSTIKFTGYCEVTFSSNEVTQYGGAIYCGEKCDITIDENVSIEFTNNTSEYGGALSVTVSSLAFQGNSSTKFTINNAERGGVFYALMSTVKFEGNISVNFVGNKAENGGAISVVKSSLIFSEKSQLWFYLNSASESGGAMHLSDQFTINISHNSHLTFHQNTANRHGGATYCDLTKSNANKIIFNTSHIVFNNNSDLAGSDVYLYILASCDEACLNKTITISKGFDQFVGIIKTSPRKLEFNDLAVTCIDYDNDSYCQVYLTNNIMLGQEIIINASVLDYYNQLAISTQFVLISKDRDYHNVIGSDNVLISRTVFQGVSIMGRKIVEADNYSITITSYDGSTSDLKEISIDLIIELSPCHPGFQYDNATQTCVCYSDSDIVSCSGITSSIKRGYWFGEVGGKATVTICPNNYCNFTCCETVNGFFKLSPVRSNQCNSQRSGIACGSCKEGYTLSFDSIECVSVDKCTIGQTVLVVTLSILYWVVIVILVFIATYYHIGIGYLYAITYYYSMVDILLGEKLYSSQELFTFISIVVSISKVTPQFLGQLCLSINLSGIDQQFIHYVHPLAVATVVAMICVSARVSYKFSLFVSRGIIHVICSLVLLSYTSVATTSLLLLRSLKFHDIGKVYTYLSPNIEYSHHRHLLYTIIAVLCIIIIVIGLPLLLLSEPFLNHKINFTKLKPLLDQFQGCYKDKYRSFAAYYMICRLLVILIIIVNPSNSNTSQYFLIILNSLLAYIHMTLMPYGSSIVNIFDGFVLQLMIVVSMVSLSDSYNPDLLLSFIVVIVILPSLPFVIMEIYLYKSTIKKITKYCLLPNPDTTNDNNEVPMRSSVGIAIDYSCRANAEM